MTLGATQAELSGRVPSVSSLVPHQRMLSPTVVLAAASLVASLTAAAWVAVHSPGGFYLLDTAQGAHLRWVEGPFGALAGAGLGPVGFSAGLIAMFAGYVGALFASRAIDPRAAWAAIVAANVIFVLAPPLLSTDIFGYLSYARLAVQHGLNPYVGAPFQATHDALLPYVYWKHATSPYGPLFTAVSYPTALLSPAVGLWIFKAIGGLASIGLTVVVSRAATFKRGDSTRAALLVGLNPVVLLYAVGGAHNDLLALLLVTWGVSLAQRGRERLGPAAVLAGAAIKATAGLALPFLLLGARRPKTALTAAGASLIVLSTATWLVFGAHVFDQLRRISSQPLYDIAFSGPDLIGRIAGSGIDGRVRFLCTGAFLLFTLVALWRVQKGGDPVAAAGWATVAMILSIASLAPWYLVWLLPWAALARGRGVLIASLALSAYIIAIHLPLLGGVPWLTPAP